MKARTISALIMLLVSASCGTAQTADIIRKVQDELELKRLHGAWVPDLLITDDGAKAYPLTGRMLVFSEGNAFGRYEGMKNVASGTFKIEDSFLRLTVENRTPWMLSIFWLGSRGSSRTPSALSSGGTGNASTKRARRSGCSGPGSPGAG